MTTKEDHTLPPMPMVSAAQVAKMARLGSTVGDIVRETRLATVVVEDILRNAKAPVRRTAVRGPQMSRRKFDHAAAAVAVSEGDTKRFTARRLGVSENAVRVAVKQQASS